ncbi:hypothetical protein ACROYT_G014731 [Oculina patagonica]
MSGSGVENLRIESEICGSNVAAKIINGTNYNKAIRAHKLTLKALERLQWDSFLEWLERNGEVNETAINCIKEKKQNLLSPFKKSKAFYCNIGVKSDNKHLSYKEYDRKFSALFAFWNEYMQMLSDRQTQILASQNESAVKITNTLHGEDIIPLYSDHEEADSRMFVHCKDIANQPLDASKRIIIFSPDTDMAVLCWYHFSQLSIQELWVHTGCDSSSNFQGIGKKGAFTSLKKCKDDFDGLKNLGSDCAVISDVTVTVCFKLIGLLYGEATSNLNHLRYKLFTKKHLDSSELPPTEDSTEQTINALFGHMPGREVFH